jgi:hypothetical protein
MRRPIHLLVFLFITVLAMAGVYELMWQTRPDYFRVQSGVNYLPLDLDQIAHEYSAYSDKRPLPELSSQPPQEDAARQIEETYSKFQQASVSLANKKAEYATRLQADTGAYTSFENSQWAQYETFVAQKTVPFDNRKKAIEAQMTAIIANSGAKSADELPPGQAAIDRARLMVELKRVEVQRAIAESDARQYGMRHLEDFQQEPNQKEYLSRYKELEDLRKSIFAEENSTNALHGQLYDAFIKYRAARGGQLGYWDFVYFSVGAATTATFGDIAPNSTRVRMFVCLQVFVSLLVTGLIVNSVASHKDALLGRTQ